MQRASTVLSLAVVDLYFAAVSLTAFLSGSCIGFYYGVVRRSRA